MLLHENVLEAAVVGVKMDGFGEVPRAFVVIKSNQAGEKESKLQLLQFVHCEF